MQKSQIALVQTKLIDINEQVSREIDVFLSSPLLTICYSPSDKEVAYKNQLMEHSKKQSYGEMMEMVRNKYTLNLRTMHSTLAQQIRECEDKNGDIRFISRTAMSKFENIDKVVYSLEKVDAV